MSSPAGRTAGTANSARIADDAVGDAKWCFWNYPRVPWDKVVDDTWRERNDDLAWLYTQVDVFAPCFYRRRYTTWDENDPSSCDPTRNRSPDQQARVWAAAMVECHRLRDKFRPDAEIVPFIWWHYDKAAADCHFSILNDIDVAESIRVPRRWGADGVYLWGYFSFAEEDEDLVIPLDRPIVQDILEAQWAEVLWSAACPR